MQVGFHQWWLLSNTGTKKSDARRYVTNHRRSIFTWDSISTSEGLSPERNDTHDGESRALAGTNHDRALAHSQRPGRNPGSPENGPRSFYFCDSANNSREL